MKILPIKNCVIKLAFICNRFFSFLTEVYISLKIPKTPLNKEKNRNLNIIVSLTSIPQRYDKLHLVIKSIMLQSVKADEIILYLDSTNDKLPKKLKAMQRYGLKIVQTSELLKPHKKYYYAMQEFPEALIITIDDDMIYEKNMIRLLLESYRKYPNAISAKRVHRMKTNPDGSIANYADWEYECQSISEPSMALFATGCGGVLYPPHLLNETLFNTDLIIKECLNADDVWLKFMQILNHVPVVFVPGKRVLPIIIGAQTVALSASNVGNNKNDKYIKNLEKLFHVSLGDYCCGKD